MFDLFLFGYLNIVLDFELFMAASYPLLLFYIFKYLRKNGISNIGNMWPFTLYTAYFQQPIREYGSPGVSKVVWASRKTRTPAYSYGHVGEYYADFLPKDLFLKSNIRPANAPCYIRHTLEPVSFKSLFCKILNHWFNRAMGFYYYSREEQFLYSIGYSNHLGDEQFLYPGFSELRAQNLQ